MEENKPCNNTWFTRLYLVVFCLLQTSGPSSAAAVACNIEPNCFPSRCNLNHGELIVVAGSSVTMNCSVLTGGPLGNIFWKWKRETVKNASSSSSLVLQNVTTQFGSGTYKCECFSGNGYDETSITIEETRKPKELKVTNSPKVVVEGYPMELECKFSGRPIPRIVWLKDNKLIINGSEGFSVLEKRFNTIALQSILQLSPVRLEHNERIFTCNVTNNLGSFKKDIQLLVKCPKIITTVSPIVRAYVFSSTKLECFIHDSKCDYEWRLNGTDLQGGNRYNITDEKVDSGRCKRRFTLNIFNLTEKDKGDYTCEMTCWVWRRKATVGLQIYREQPPLTTTEQPGSTAVSYDERNEQRPLPVAFIVSPTAFVCLALLITIVVFKWKRKIHRKKYEVADESRQDESLFISYSSIDFHWVTNSLIPLLQKHSINYRIHNRDFQLGRPIVQNMADSVYGSRKVLIVLSNNYLASNFCMEELSMALRRNADTVILVRIQQLKKSRLTLALRNMKPLDYENLKEKGNWEEKIVSEITNKMTSTV